MDLIGSNKTKPHGQIDGNRDSLAYLCSKKRRFAFQTFTESPTTTPSLLGFGITHQPHEGGDGAKCGAKFADTPCITISKASGGKWTSTSLADPPWFMPDGNPSRK